MNLERANRGGTQVARFNMGRVRGPEARVTGFRKLSLALFIAVGAARQAVRTILVTYGRNQEDI